ncbi:MAG: DASS family sodium-coupled anion symporter [Planctomycetota bacterium]
MGRRKLWRRRRLIEPATPTGGEAHGAARLGPSERRPWALAVAVVLAIAAYALAGALPFAADTGDHAPRMALAVTALTAGCWLLRALPLGAASLLPLALLPLLGAQPTADVAKSYAHPILWLFVGGFILALGVERWDLHRRLALWIIARLGVRPRRLVLGFLLAGLVLSMWLSNTATALMLLPIGQALADRLQRETRLDHEAGRRLGLCLMLAIAYGCSIGGVASPLGSPTNLLFLSFWQGFQERGAPVLSFPAWLLCFVPLAVGMGLVTWAFLVRVAHPLPRGSDDAVESLRRELAALPRLNAAQRRVLALFGLAALLWATRADIQIGGGPALPGWASLLGYPDRSWVHDGSVAVAVAIAMFVVPSGGRGSPPLMDWPTASRLRFDILFLLGGGIAIAGALTSTGVCDALGESLGPALAGTSPWLAVLAVVLFVIFLTEITSNTAIIAVMLPVLIAVAAQAEVDPRVVMLPATIAASFAFMFPVATPPNAVVFASGRVTFAQMAATGFALNLVAALALWGWCRVWVFPLLGIDVDTVPPWGR